MSGWNPPPGQGGPPYGGPGGPVYGGPPTPPGFPQPPPPRKSNTGLIIGLVAGGLVLVLVLVVVVLVATDDSEPERPGAAATASATASPTPSVTDGTNLRIVEASSAGGWSRDPAAEAQLASEITQQRTIMTNATQGKLDNIITAFYKDPDGTPLSGRPAGVFFVGGEGGLGDPSAFVTALRGSSATATTEEVTPGPNGGRAVCQTLTQNGIAISYCAWATHRTFGMIMPSLPGRSAGAMADLMRRMRPDLEQPK